MEWSKVLAESSIQGYEPMDGCEDQTELAARVFHILQENLPKGCVWRSVICDGNELVPNASTILAMDLLQTKSSEYFSESLGNTGEYIRGYIGRDLSGEVIWISWGVGCPFDSGCDEILTVVSQS